MIQSVLFSMSALGNTRRQPVENAAVDCLLRFELSFFDECLQSVPHQGHPLPYRTLGDPPHHDPVDRILRSGMVPEVRKDFVS